MKRALIFGAVLSCVFFGADATPAEAPAPLAESDFVFTLGGREYRLGDVAQPLIRQAESLCGEFEEQAADSCMFAGQDKEFGNEALLIATYPIGPEGEDVVETILVQREGFPTARGIGVGSAKSEVIAAYGEAFTLDYDQMIYAMGDPVIEPVLVFELDLTTDCVSMFFMMRNTAGQ